MLQIGWTKERMKHKRDGREDVPSQEEHFPCQDAKLLAVSTLYSCGSPGIMWGAVERP